MFIGVLFASVFDTATQASAWGYVASSNGGVVAAFLAGLVFTAGMVITDSIDGRLICRIRRSAQGPAAGRRFRRTLGWVIVAMSYTVRRVQHPEGLDSGDRTRQVRPQRRWLGAGGTHTVFLAVGIEGQGFSQRRYQVTSLGVIPPQQR